MAILFQTAEFKPANTQFRGKFNDRQYFRLYGTVPHFFDVRTVYLRLAPSP